MLITLLIPTSGRATVLGHDVVNAPRDVSLSSLPGARRGRSQGWLIGTEVALGVGYGAIGLVALRLLEVEGRRRATLEIQ